MKQFREGPMFYKISAYFFVLSMFFIQSGFAVESKPPANVQEYKSKVFLVEIPSNIKQTSVPGGRARQALAKITQIKSTVKKAAATYGIDPVHIAAAVAAEHQFNMSYLDDYSDYNVQRWFGCQSRIR